MTLSPIIQIVYIVVYDLHLQSYDYLVIHIGLWSRELESGWNQKFSILIEYVYII